MTAVRRWLATRTGRLLTHDLTLAAGAGIASWDAAGRSITWGAATAAAVVAGKTLLRLLLPVPQQRKPPKVGHTEYRHRIPERVVKGKPLGRHVHHDSRSLNYLVTPLSRRQLRKTFAATGSVVWARQIGVLDQGNVGSCTGNAAVGQLGTSPIYFSLDTLRAAGLTLDEAEALRLYSAAETIDGNGTYPPVDDGSTGLSVSKATKQAGLIAGYTHMITVAAAKTAILDGPFIVGSNWYDSMDTPNGAGVVSIPAGAQVRGGHEYECVGYHPSIDRWEFVNSWGTSWGLSGRFFYSTATFRRLLAEDGDAVQFTPIASSLPIGGAQVAVDAPDLVDRISELAARNSETPHDYLDARLRSLWTV